MKDIMIKIVGKQLSRDADEADQIEFITEGRYDETNGVVSLQYEESDFSGMAGCITELTIAGDTVRMRRSGEFVPISTEIEFCRGKRFTGLYQTAFGAVEMEVLTNELVDRICRRKGSGSLAIDYDISLRGLTENRNSLAIEIVDRVHRERSAR